MPTATVSTARPGIDFGVGTSIPPATAHAVSVSLPLWQDNVDYEEGRLSEVMQTGYPRFFIHRSIQRLASVLLARFGHKASSPDAEAEDCILVPSKRVAESCRAFMQSHCAKARSSNESSHLLPVRAVQVCLNLPTSTPPRTASGEDGVPSSLSSSWASLPPQSQSDGAALDDCNSAAAKLSIHIVLFPKSAFPLAKSFWQHTGDGISSRMAETYLDLLDQRAKLSSNGSNGESAHMTPSASTSSIAASTQSFMKNRSYSKNRHYSRTGSATNALVQSSASTPSTPDGAVDELCPEHSTYLEERYGRNMARVQASKAKEALRKRIAGAASNDVLCATAESQLKSTGADVDIAPRVIEEGVNESHVFLYPTGMSAIFHAHQLALQWKDGKSVCFGFPYLDTLKILEKWGPGCFFFGFGNDEDLERLETLLQAGQKITSLFCEFPSNPLLRSANIQRLRQLADTYEFLIIIDETIGNFVNVEVLPHADIVVSSLTKIFSGEANGMGGNLILNPNGKWFSQLNGLQEQEYEDNFFDQNAIFLERNSRDFVQRVRGIDHNTVRLVEMLVEAREGAYCRVLKDIYYPTLCTRDNYEACKRPGGGYGGLFSLTFHSMRAAMAFYDALECAKGPSLGTNFTLASPFVILAHYTELDWAAQYGVEANLVRVSVGLEESQNLLSMFRKALEASALVA